MADEQAITLHLNGKTRTAHAEPDQPLLYTLREFEDLNAPHFGCGLGQCGACTVHVDGKPVRSCIAPTSMAVGKEITTLAGIGTADKPHPIQAAYIAEETPQCGYCVSGWMMTAAALLKKTPNPTDADIRKALVGLKCRCGTHAAIIRAVKRAAAMTA